MVEGFQPIRYSVIEDKNPREIVMLVGDGCKWRKCRFCDYHLDSSKDIQANFKINEQVLSHVTGLYHELEVINSGSFVDLDSQTIEMIKKICLEKDIKEVHFECHYMHRNEVEAFKQSFARLGVRPIIKLGLETFDDRLREAVLVKGIDEKNPEIIAKYFDEINLLQGISGQNAETMINDIETGLKYFERVCVNIMVENQMPIKPDKKVIEEFMNYVYPIYKDNVRVDILLNNTDFGVG
ncbi:radical SAM protein [uncultured Eubacterium sp.]|uniref:radical SAM protein n=1 Tax=uncultured Eubacterium sp. TaxID=165185 RepID=UPI0026732375|nr:radical SAM protein [uncultured Eubacterium sp.]